MILDVGSKETRSDRSREQIEVANVKAAHLYKSVQVKRKDWMGFSESWHRERF